MVVTSIKTPGVYTQELNGFPNSVVAVATAVPAFIGYTPQASYLGQSYLNVPTKVSSLSEFETFFCLPDPPPPADPSKQYSPGYYLVAQKSQPVSGAYILINNVYYSVLPDPSTVYYLYNSVQLFYQNGGGDAYIVSVGPYGPAAGKPMTAGAPLINPNVQLNDLKRGLGLLQNEDEPTMYICPEATLLSVGDNGTLMATMLSQCAAMQTAVSIFDIIGSKYPDPNLFMNDIQAFRNSTGSLGLSYGAAYYPFIGTTTMQNSDIDYTSLFGGDTKQLATIIIDPTADPTKDPTTLILNNIANKTGGLTVSQYNNALLVASQTYNQIITTVLSDANLLPPSGAMAGIITNTDGQNGPWEAPANVSIIGASSLPIKISESQQAPFNVDAVSGKSVNVIRSFNGSGILVWGARTLDGNSGDWRYLSVRRTMILLEQSCKLAARAYVFQPNDKNTWEAIKAMIGSFLTSVWKEGGLQGPTPAAAFSVDCGLGTTMTGDDVLAGFLFVKIMVAVVRPAEFIVITFQQQMPVAG